MKKFTFLLALLGGFAFTSQAQRIETVPQTSADVGLTPIKQGNWMVGGSLGNLGYSFEGEAFNIQLQPRAGYFVSDGIAVGAQATLGFTTVNDRDNEWNYGIVSFLRYYFSGGATASSRFLALGDIVIAESSNGNNVCLPLRAIVGYAYIITLSFALGAILGYNDTTANV